MMTLLHMFLVAAASVGMLGGNSVAPYVASETDEPFRSVELNLAELSPRGVSGGYAVPASGEAPVHGFSVSNECISQTQVIATINFSSTRVPAEDLMSIQIGGNTYNVSAASQTQISATVAHATTHSAVARVRTGSPRTGFQYHNYDFTFTTPSCSEVNTDPIDVTLELREAGGSWTESDLSIEEGIQAEARWSANGDPDACYATEGAGFSTGGAAGGTDTTLSEPPVGDEEQYAVMCVKRNLTDPGYRFPTADFYPEPASPKFGKQYLRTITCSRDDGTQETFGQSSHWVHLSRTVSEAIAEKGLPFSRLPRITSGQAYEPILRTQNGVEHQETLNAVCAILGYENYVSSSCSGGCNFDSPDNNNMYRFHGSVGIDGSTLTVGEAGPTVTLEVDVNASGSWTDDNITIDDGDQIRLRWDSTNADTCSGSNFSTGSAADGTQSTVTEPNAGSSRTYSVLCTGPGGTANDSLVVTADATGGVPTLTANPVYVRVGSESTLTWNTAGNPPASCTLTGPEVNMSSLSSGTGNTDVEIYGESTYTLTCPGGSDDATVFVLPVVQET